MVPLDVIDCEVDDDTGDYDDQGVPSDQMLGADNTARALANRSADNADGVPIAGASEAKLSYKARKGLPSSSFLYKSPDGKLHLPYRTSSGALDKAHLRAIVQWGIAKLKGVPDSVKSRLMAKAQRLAKSAGIQVSEATEVVQETFTDSVYARPILEQTVNAQGLHQGKLLISKADYVNRNNRVYPLDVWRREVAKHQDKVEAGMLLGQAEHPEGRPQLLDQFLKFTGLQLENKDVFATFTVIPTSKGRDFTEIARAGVRIGTSTRGAGSVKRESRGGREVSVIQPDYELLGIDVMLFGEQSVDNAGMVQFESIEADPAESPETTNPTESDMPVLETVEALREAYPALVAQIEAPLTEKLSASEAAQNGLNENLKAVNAALSLADASADPRPAIQALQEQLSEAQASLSTLTESNAAFRRLAELAQELPHGSWLVVEHLKGETTVAAIEREFPRVKALVEGAIDHAITGMGTVIAQPSDKEHPAESAPANEAKQPEVIKGDPRLLSAAGAISFRKS